VAIGTRSALIWHSPDLWVLRERGFAHENAYLEPEFPPIPLEITIRRLRRDLSDQRISEDYNILLGDLGHRVIRALAEKLQKLRKTAA
jgi:hypothetical protein